MTLNHEIETAARQVSTDAFSLTIGEISNMYRDGDIIINPNFQRLFRWDIERKSRLIESILVRIPLPPIFVFELPDSKWEVIDGLQRLSTILEFMGDLKGADGIGYSPARSLVGTQYLPSLSGAFWSQELLEAQMQRDAEKKAFNSEDYLDVSSAYYAFDGNTQRAIKRTKISVQLLEKKSDPKSKFDLFQRLNSGGISANDQEIRNCAIVMTNEGFFAKISEISLSPPLSELIPLGNVSIRKSNHLDNLCKIIAFSFITYRVGVDIEEFVTSSMIEIAQWPQHDIDRMLSTLTEGIEILVQACGVNALRPFKDGVFSGRVGRTSIEIILVGILQCIDNIRMKPSPSDFVRDTIVDFWASDNAKKFSAAGIAGTDRVQYTVPLGISLFSA